MRIVHQWLAEFADIPADVETVAREISLRGFEVASVDGGVIDFEITANRPDCLSHVGMAREARAIWSGSSPARTTDAAAGSSAGAVEVTIEAPDLCPRYAAQLFDVKVGPSPAWMIERLDAAGIRAINNIVDVTNYVMLEIGQPMHAFDLDRLRGGRLVIRRARPGEKLTTLDGVERTLDPEMLMIADAERVVAVGGVMGGRETEIGPGTTRMVLESAYFNPASVRRTSKRLGLKTEASTRFERGGDIEAPLRGLARAAQLLQQIGAATAGAIADVYPAPHKAVQLMLRAARVERLLGVAVPNEDVPRLLTPLGFDVRAIDGDRWQVTVPSFRVDVRREADLIEEVGRHFGFERIPTTFPALTVPQAAPDPRVERDRRIRTLLTASGLSESMTFAFVERIAAQPFCADGFEPVAIANPLSEKFAVLRPSLLPGLIDSAAHNRRRGRKDVRLFEIGSRYTSAGEGRAVAVLCTGTREPIHWSGAPRAVDFFDVKGVIERLATALAVEDLRFDVEAEAFLVPGRTAKVRSGDTPIGYLGLLDPRIAERRGFPASEEMFVAEIDLDAVNAVASTDDVRAASLPRYPSIVRDLSILVSEALPAEVVRGTIRSAAPDTLQSIVEFDRYQGKGVPDRHVSLSLRLTFQSPERTLTDDEADAAMTAIVETLARERGAQRR